MSEGFAALRDRAKAGVIEPLLAMGMRKPKGVTAEDHAAMLDRLAEKLAWMDPKWHPALVEVIARNAVAGRSGRSTGKPPRDVWPSEVVILNWARSMCPLARVTRLAGTWMRSADGVETLARDPFEASALYDFLQRGLPPGERGRAEIRDRASALRGKHAEFSRRAVDGVALPEQLAWLERWEERRSFLQRVVSGEIADTAMVPA